MFKVGDEVLVKGEITGTQNGSKYKFDVRFCGATHLFFSEEEMIPAGETYSKGLADAWEMADKLNNMKLEDIVEVFGIDIAIEEVFKEISPKEALAKIEAYEKEKAVCVGDVVVFSDGTKALVVDEAIDDTVFVLTENGCVERWERKALKKTDKKIPISGLLLQIGE